MCAKSGNWPKGNPCASKCVLTLLLAIIYEPRFVLQDGKLATDVDLMKKTFGWGVKIKKAIEATLNLAKKFSPLKKVQQLILQVDIASHGVLLFRNYYRSVKLATLKVSEAY